MSRAGEPVTDHAESLLPLMLDAFVVAGFDGYVKVFNPAFAQMLGYSEQELLATPYLELVHPDDLESVEAAWADLATGADLVGFVCRLVCADHTVRWVEWHTKARPEEGLVYAVGRDVTDRRMANDELSALRRVATLVAEGKEPEELFAVVAKEVADLIDVPVVGIARYELDDTATACASFSPEGPLFPAGRRWSLEGTSTLRLVRDTSAPARIDDYSGLEGEIADFIRGVGLRSSVGIPISVAGLLWGAIVVTSAQRLSDGTEARLADFSELIATAIANAESRDALKVLADEQASLRRVATLVAEGASQAAVLDAMAREMQELLGAYQVALNRFEPDAEIVVLAHRGMGVPVTVIGARVSHEGENATSIVRRTGRPARIENYDEATGVLGEHARATGIRSSVSAPIMVEGEVWGLITASWQVTPPPANTEERMAKFAQLLETAIANSEARGEVARLAEEQAALRRVATLVARESSPMEVLDAVTEEAWRALDTEAVGLLRFEPDGTATLVAQSETPWDPPPLGTRFTLDGENVITEVLRTGKAARDDDWTKATGSVAAMASVLGVRSSVATPIVVEGRLWGSLVATTSKAEPLPAETESRIGQFTELVATAIANTEARAEVERLADEQGALRRVATLVAEGVQPTEVFSAVSREVERVFAMDEAVDLATVVRFDPGPEFVLVGAAKSFEGLSIGARWEPHDAYVSTRVFRTGRSARIEEKDLAEFEGPHVEILRRHELFSQVGSPILVEGRMWGAVTMNAKETLPHDAERRLERFTELVATAIANAESRSELAASRRRIVAASDETRREIERNLHDGTQQRLVSLGLAVRAAEAAVPADRPDLQADLSHIAAGLTGAVEDIQELSRGIHPAILSRGGLVPALRTLARRSAIPVELDVSTDVSIPQPIEVAAYFVASEGLVNASKHAEASRIELSLAQIEGDLLLAIRDDGVGGADPARGSGLVGLTDRVEALGGSLEIESRPGDGTQIIVRLPIELAPDSLEEPA
jgi:PAS domain S-box-containing protein